MRRRRRNSRRVDEGQRGRKYSPELNGQGRWVDMYILFAESSMWRVVPLHGRSGVVAGFDVEDVSGFLQGIPVVIRVGIILTDGILPEIDRFNVFEFADVGSGWQIPDANLLSLVDEQRAGQGQLHESDELGALEAKFIAVVAVARYTAGDVVVFDEDAVPAVVLEHDGLPFGYRLKKVLEFPRSQGQSALSRYVVEDDVVEDEDHVQRTGLLADGLDYFANVAHAWHLTDCNCVEGLQDVLLEFLQVFVKARAVDVALITRMIFGHSAFVFVIHGFFGVWEVLVFADEVDDVHAISTDTGTVQSVISKCRFDQGQ